MFVYLNKMNCSKKKNKKKMYFIPCSGVAKENDDEIHWSDGHILGVEPRGGNWPGNCGSEL